VTATTPAPLVLVSVDQLRELVRDAVAEAIAEHVAEPAPRLVDRRGLAQALGCCVDTVDRLRREGAPELTVGDAPRFEIDRVLEWIRTRSTP